MNVRMQIYEVASSVGAGQELQNGRAGSRHMRNYSKSVRAAFIAGGLSLLLLSGSLITTNAHSSLPVALVHVTQADSAVPYTAMGHTEKKEYMRDVLTPRFGQMFMAFDAKRFPQMKCVTCHGNGARTSEFKMPDEKLPKLPKSDAGMKKLEVKIPAMVKFMRDSVAPLTAQMLGMKEYKCEGCHMLK